MKLQNRPRKSGPIIQKLAKLRGQGLGPGYRISSRGLTEHAKKELALLKEAGGIPRRSFTASPTAASFAPIATSARWWHGAATYPVALTVPSFSFLAYLRSLWRSFFALFDDLELDEIHYDEAGLTWDVRELEHQYSRQHRTLLQAKGRGPAQSLSGRRLMCWTPCARQST